jgi:alkylation response protein AidB-like acyl-CoA dehydrogenase
MRGLLLVRTNREVPKHHGITCMVVEMSAAGVTVRPLRQMTGESRFNEVFLDDVFIPDGDVLGEVDRGWVVARTTIGNERVSLGDLGWAAGKHWELIEHRVLDRAPLDPRQVSELGRLSAVASAARALNLRAAARAIAAGGSATDGNLAKLVAAENAQQIADFGLSILGDGAVYADGDEGALTTFWLSMRMLTLAGGTSEIVRNVLAERVLGLPRDTGPTG